MLEALKNFFFANMNPPEEEGEEPGARDRELRLAACALLLELAHADDEFTADERQHLVSAVRRHFSLDRREADELLSLAERARSRAPDLWEFTSLIRRHYSVGQKMVLAEIMWGVVFADGELSSREEYLLRKLSHLLGLEIGYLSEARDRVRDPGEPPPGVD